MPDPTEGDLLPDGTRYCEACAGPCRIEIPEEEDA